MNSDLETDENRAAATPRDWVQDFNFHGGYVLHCCANCLRNFRSFPVRELCAQCDSRSSRVEGSA